MMNCALVITLGGDHIVLHLLSLLMHVAVLMWSVPQRFMCWKLGPQCTDVKMVEALSG